MKADKNNGTKLGLPGLNLFSTSTRGILMKSKQEKLL